MSERPRCTCGVPGPYKEHSSTCAAAVTPLGEGGDETLVRDSGSADAEVRNELRFFSEASAAALHALEDSLPPNDPVSLPPQRSDETLGHSHICHRCGSWCACDGGEWGCRCCAARSGAEDGTIVCDACDRKVSRELLDGQWEDANLCWPCSSAQRVADAEEETGKKLEAADSEVTTLRAQLAEARKRIKLMDRVIVEHHSASVLREEHHTCPVCMAQGGVEFFAATDALLRTLAAVHPTEENR